MKKYQMWVKRHKKYFEIDLIKTQSGCWFNTRYYNQFGFDNIFTSSSCKEDFANLVSMAKLSRALVCL